MASRSTQENADELRSLILGHTAVTDNNGLCIPCGDTPLYLDDNGKFWFLEEFFHLEACAACPYAEFGGGYGYSTLTRKRFIWLLIQGRKRWAENARRDKAGLKRTPLNPCKPMPGDPQPHFWSGYRWKETYGG